MHTDNSANHTIPAIVAPLVVTLIVGHCGGFDSPWVWRISRIITLPVALGIVLGFPVRLVLKRGDSQQPSPGEVANRAAPEK